MRLVAVVTVLSAVAVPVASRSETLAFPIYDIAKTCHDQAAYAFAATLGDVDIGHETDLCAAREQKTRAEAQTAWPRAPEPLRAECADLANGRYARLAACLVEPPGRGTAR